MGYIFKSGKFEGLSIEQAYLTRYVELKIFIKWARKKDNLIGIARQFDTLENIISKKRLKADQCYQLGCDRPAIFISMLENSPDPYFWCDVHDPWESSAIKEPISFRIASIFSKKMNKDIFVKCYVML